MVQRLAVIAQMMPGHAERRLAVPVHQRGIGRLLAAERPVDPGWIDALEMRMAEHGAALAVARAETLTDLQTEIDALEREYSQYDRSLENHLIVRELRVPRTVALDRALNIKGDCFLLQSRTMEDPVLAKPVREDDRSAIVR